jgi:uncharacterized protein (DUF2235 family)
MKRIITCSDGTWNKPGAMFDGKYVRTNVQKIFEAICKSVTPANSDAVVKQVKYYDEGVGSEGTPWSKLIGGATGKGIDNNIKDAYKFIVWNYEPGDEIFIFGFSRGAYTARSLAGMIHNCGILKNNDLRLIDKAYDMYRNRDKEEFKPGGIEAMKFKADNCYPEERIKFVGVWDTVGALGIPIRAFQFINKAEYAFHDTTLGWVVQNAYHALAVDESRGSFKPTLWTLNPDQAKRAADQTLVQVWFSGVHSHVGGGYPDEGLSDIALQWMVAHAKKHGLGFDEAYLMANLKPNPAGTWYNSRSGLFKYLPGYVRPVLKTELSNETIDSTVYERMKLMPPTLNPLYKPINVDLLIEQ